MEECELVPQQVGGNAGCELDCGAGVQDGEQAGARAGATAGLPGLPTLECPVLTVLAGDPEGGMPPEIHPARREAEGDAPGAAVLLARPG